METPLLQNPQRLLVAGRASPPRPGGPGLPLPLRGPLVLDLNSSLALVCPEDTSFNPFSIYPTPSCSSGPHTDPASSRKPFPDRPCPRDAPSLQGPWLHHSTVGSRLPDPPSPNHCHHQANRACTQLQFLARAGFLPPGASLACSGPPGPPRRESKRFLGGKNDTEGSPGLPRGLLLGLFSTNDFS